MELDEHQGKTKQNKLKKTLKINKINKYVVCKYVDFLESKLSEKQKEIDFIKQNINFAIESINDFQEGGCSKHIKDAKHILKLI